MNKNAEKIKMQLEDETPETVSNHRGKNRQINRLSLRETKKMLFSVSEAVLLIGKERKTVVKYTKNGILEGVKDENGNLCKPYMIKRNSIFQFINGAPPDELLVQYLFELCGSEEMKYLFSIIKLLEDAIFEMTLNNAVQEDTAGVLKISWGKEKISIAFSQLQEIVNEMSEGFNKMSEGFNKMSEGFSEMAEGVSECTSSLKEQSAKCKKAASSVASWGAKDEN